MQNKITQLNINNFGKPAHTNGCDMLYRSIVGTCNALTGSAKGAYMAAAWSTYQSPDMSGTNDIT